MKKRVYIIYTNEGKFITANESGGAVAITTLPVGTVIVVGEMAEEEYRHLPATMESLKFFRAFRT